MLVLLALTAACAHPNTPTAFPPCTPTGILREGDHIPDCTFEAMGGGSVRPAALTGKPLVLNFWASWCIACRKETPAFQRVHLALGDRVRLVGMDLLGIQDETREEARTFARSKGVTYTMAFDQGGLFYTQFGTNLLRPVAPITVFVDGGGVVRLRNFGEMSESDIRAQLRALFGIS